MTYSAPAVAGSYTITNKQARQLWNWLLRQQGLSNKTKFESAVEIARAALGLHAARLPSPFSTVLARGSTPAVALSLFTPLMRSELMTVRCMRKTLHTLPLPLASSAHCATMHFRERDALRSIVNAGISSKCIARITDAIVDLLEETGPLFHREIEARLAGRRTTVIAIRLAIKLAWERGQLTYLNETTGWNREYRKFALTNRIYPEFDMFMDREKATVELVCEYFDRYGPASMRDVTWWSGLSRSTIALAMMSSARDFVLIHGPWSESPMYMYQDKFEEFHSTPSTRRRSGLNFLAHEDVALKAYFETRARYLGKLPPRRAFNQIGEVLPSILLDGQVVGTWAWEKSTVTYLIEDDFFSADLRKEANNRANALSEALRLGWAQKIN